MAEGCKLGIDDLTDLSLEASARGFVSPCSLCPESSCAAARVNAIVPASISPDVAVSMLDVRHNRTQGGNVNDDLV